MTQTESRKNTNMNIGNLMFWKSEPSLWKKCQKRTGNHRDQSHQFLKIMNMKSMCWRHIMKTLLFSIERRIQSISSKTTLHETFSVLNSTKDGIQPISWQHEMEISIISTQLRESPPAPTPPSTYSAQSFLYSLLIYIPSSLSPRMISHAFESFCMHRRSTSCILASRPYSTHFQTRTIFLL